MLTPYKKLHFIFTKVFFSASIVLLSLVFFLGGTCGSSTEEDDPASSDIQTTLGYCYHAAGDCQLADYVELLKLPSSVTAQQQCATLGYTYTSTKPASEGTGVLGCCMHDYTSLSLKYKTCSFAGTATGSCSDPTYQEYADACTASGGIPSEGDTSSSTTPSTTTLTADTYEPDNSFTDAVSPGCSGWAGVPAGFAVSCNQTNFHSTSDTADYVRFKPLNPGTYTFKAGKDGSSNALDVNIYLYDDSYGLIASATTNNGTLNSYAVAQIIWSNSTAKSVYYYLKIVPRQTGTVGVYSFGLGFSSK